MAENRIWGISPFRSISRNQERKGLKMSKSEFEEKVVRCSVLLRD